LAWFGFVARILRFTEIQQKIKKHNKKKFQKLSQQVICPFQVAMDKLA